MATRSNWMPPWIPSHNVVNSSSPTPRFERAWLGVTLEQTDDGILIDSVAEESPAAEAGLQAGDMLTAINDESVETGDEAATIISAMEPGDSVTISIMRDGESQEIEATLGAVMDRGFNAIANSDIVIFDGEHWRIKALSAESALADAGLQAGDVVTAINGESMDMNGLAALLEEMAEDTTVTVTIERDGETQDLEVPAAALSEFNSFSFRTDRPFGEFEFRGPRERNRPVQL